MNWMRRLPNGKAISGLGFGCASLWSKPDFPEDRAQEMLRVAAAEGINHFDTGSSYGPGHGERRLGRFLAGENRDSLVVSTKVGSNFIDGRVVRGFTPELMQRSFDGSMKRLGLDFVDILYLHGPRVGDLNDGTFEFFARLKAEGRISYAGVNSFDQRVQDALVGTPIDAVMLQYNAGFLRSRAQIDRLAADGKFVISATALSRAKFDLSTFVPRNRHSLWYLLRMLRREPLFVVHGMRLARRLARTGKPAPEAAIQFTMGHPKILSTLFGTTRAAHVAANARAGHGALTPEQWAMLARR